MVEVHALGQRVSNAEKIHELGKRVEAQHPVLFEIHHEPAAVEAEGFENARIVILRQAAEVGVAAKVVEEIGGDRAPHDVGVIGIVAFQCCDHEILQTFALEDPPDVRSP